MRMNAAEVLLAGGDDAGTAIVCAATSLRRGELRAEVARGAAVWRARGLSRGERVAIKLVDGIDWVMAYLSVIWAGGVAVGVNPRVPADEWQAILASADFRFILSQEAEDTAPASELIDLVDWRDELAAAAPELPRAMEGDEPGALGPLLGDERQAEGGRPRAADRARGRPRRRRRRSASVQATGSIASSKLFFAYPLANSVFTGLRLGATVILDPGWPSARGVAAIAMRQRPDVLFSVPSLYRNLLKEGLAGPLANCGVRRYVSAGEALPANLRDQWKRQTGCTIVDGYGASETLVLVLVDTARDEGCKPRRASRSRRSARRARQRPARVLVHGPTVALGYWRRPAAQAEQFVAGGFTPVGPVRCGRATRAGASPVASDSLVKVHGRWVESGRARAAHRRGLPLAGRDRRRRVADDDGVEAVALFYVAVADAPSIDAARCASTPIACRRTSGRAGCMRSRPCRAPPPASSCGAACAICTRCSRHNADDGRP